MSYILHSTANLIKVVADIFLCLFTLSSVVFLLISSQIWKKYLSIALRPLKRFILQNGQQIMDEPMGEEEINPHTVSKNECSMYCLNNFVPGNWLNDERLFQRI